MAATTIVEHFENGSISNIIDIGLKSICAKFHASIPKGTILTHIYCTIWKKIKSSQKNVLFCVTDMYVIVRHVHRCQFAALRH